MWVRFGEVVVLAYQGLHTLHVYGQEQVSYKQDGALRFE